jgi:hypothetical protein
LSPRAAVQFSLYVVLTEAFEPHPIAMECFTSACHQELLGIRRLEMKINQPAYEPQDGALAGILIIALFSMFIGILLGLFVA